MQIHPNIQRMRARVSILAHSPHAHAHSPQGVSPPVRLKFREVDTFGHFRTSTFAEVCVGGDDGVRARVCVLYAYACVYAWVLYACVCRQHHTPML